MSKCNSQVKLGNLHGKQIIADFDGGLVGSDGGLMLLRKVDEQVGLTERLAEVLSDGRVPNKVEFTLTRQSPKRLFAPHFVHRYE